MAHVFPPVRFLIVDDVAASRETLEGILHSPDYHFHFATNGHEAVALAAQVRPDLILLDIMMPDLDGYEVCRRLRANPELAETPVVLVTALDDRASLRQGLQAGADDIFGKPFDAMELRARVALIARLNRRRLQGEAQGHLVRAVEAAERGLVVVEHGRVVYANPPARRLLAPSGPERVDSAASGAASRAICAIDPAPDGQYARWELISKQMLPQSNEAVG
jgi:CheY-like chemotaxis protein